MKPGRHTTSYDLLTNELTIKKEQKFLSIQAEEIEDRLFEEVIKLNKTLPELCRQGDLDGVKECLKKKDSKLLIQMPGPDGQYPLHHAARQGYSDIVNHLLGFLNLKDILSMLDPDGRLPVHAVLQSKKPNVKILIAFFKKGIPMDVMTCKTRADSGKIIDSTQRTLLHIAAFYGHAKVVAFLLEAFSDAKLKGDDPKTKARCRRQFLNARDRGGDTALHTAVSCNAVDVVKHLLNSPDVNPRPHQERYQRKGVLFYTPLVSALSLGHVECALVFLEQGCWLTPQEKETLLKQPSRIDVTAVMKDVLTHYSDSLVPKMVKNEDQTDQDTESSITSSNFFSQSRELPSVMPIRSKSSSFENN